MAFETTWTVRLSDVDDSGLIYYPRLFVAANNAVESLMLDAGRPPMNDRDVLLPVVGAEASYRSPLRRGDVVTLSVSVSLGTTSLSFHVEGTREGTEACSMTERHVAVDPDTFTKVELPPSVRESFAPHEE